MCTIGELKQAKVTYYKRLDMPVQCAVVDDVCTHIRNVRQAAQIGLSKHTMHVLTLSVNSSLKSTYESDLSITVYCSKHGFGGVGH